MFSKSFVAIAMLSFAFTATAFGQKEIVIWHAAKGTKTTPRKTNVKSPRDVATGQVMDAGAILGDEVKKAPTAKNQRTIKTPKGGNLIDTSTGEIVWADEVTSNQPNSSNQRTTKKPKAANIFDVSTGEILWAHAGKTNPSNAANARKSRPQQQSFDKGYLPPNANARKRNR